MQTQRRSLDPSCDNGTKIGEADIVVLANGLSVRQVEQTERFPVIARLGQISKVQETQASAKLSCVLAHDGFVLPAQDGLHTAGATFDHVPEQEWDCPHPAPSAKADAHNLLLVRKLATDVFASNQTDEDKSWTGLRCTTPDQLPLAGPVPVHDAYLSDYGDLRHGHRYKAYPAATYHPGLFVLSGLGARGLVAAPLAAELIASQALGEPLPVPQSLAEALHPGRFAIRSLKRREP